MPRPLSISFACLLILASPAFAETDGEVYEEVDRVIAEAEEGVRENLATFIQANERPLGKARSELSDLIARLNKDGRSQLATSIQKRVNSLDDTVQKRASAKVPIVQPPKKPLLERLEGKWTDGTTKGGLFYVIDDKGVFHEIFRDSGQQKGFGQLNEIASGVAKVRVNHGWEFILTPGSDDVLTLVICNPDGKPEMCVVLRREKP